MEVCLPSLNIVFLAATLSRTRYCFRLDETLIVFRALDERLWLMALFYSIELAPVPCTFLYTLLEWGLVDCETIEPILARL